MALVSVGVRLAPEVPLWCDCAEVALEPRNWGREREGERERERERERKRERERMCEVSLPPLPM